MAPPKSARCWLSVVLLGLLILQLPCCECGSALQQPNRLIVSYVPGQQAAVKAALQGRGYQILVQGPNLYAVQQGPPLPKTPKESAFVSHATLAAALSSISGVAFVEPDAERHYIEPTEQGAASTAIADDGMLATAQGDASADAVPANCKAYDTVSNGHRLSVTDYPLRLVAAQESAELQDTPLLQQEVQPYGIQQVQANTSALVHVSSTEGKGVLICIIDSGLDADHPDLRSNDAKGCLSPDTTGNVSSCPYTWKQDTTTHGTHIAGVIAASSNGLGVVGIIPNKADLFVVRVFNATRVVQKTLGVPGSKVALALSQCDAKLTALKAANTHLRYHMVISMSLGSPKLLEIERQTIRWASTRAQDAWTQRWHSARHRVTLFDMCHCTHRSNCETEVADMTLYPSGSYCVHVTECPTTSMLS